MSQCRYHAISYLQCNRFCRSGPQANVFGEMASSYEEVGGGGKPYVDKVHFNVSVGVTDLTIGAPGPDILAKSRQILLTHAHIQFHGMWGVSA